MSRVWVTGDKEIEATLKGLAEKSADKVARSALGGGLTVMQNAVKSAAPIGPTGNLRSSVGKRLEKGKRGTSITAKAGLNVGKQKKTASAMNGRPRAPHSHLVALGTAPRFRKTIGGKFAYLKRPTAAQLSTGTMPANPFVSIAVRNSLTKTKDKMRAAAAKALIKQTKAATKKG